MKRLFLALGSLLLAAYAGRPPADLAIRDVTVVDVTSGALRPDQTVLVRGDRIVAVGPTDSVAVSGRAEVVDGTGGYLIPGLWDAHVHSAANLGWHFPLYIAHGITSVRNMHTNLDRPLESVVSIRQRIATGDQLGPRFLANGGVVDGDPPVHSGSVVVRNAEEARAAVDRLADGGADFIKVYDRLTREEYFAILERAKQRGIPVDGHLPPLVTPQEAAAAGQRTVEHTSGITMGCSTEADSIRSAYVRYVRRVPTMRPYPDAAVGFFSLVRRALDTRDPALCANTVRAYREHGVVVVPTLVSETTDPREFLADPERMALLPPPLREAWKGMAEEPDPIGETLGPGAGTAAIENVGALHEGGVTILAGTDVGNPFLVPGPSLHRELERLTEAGLSALEALQSATLLPARVFGLQDSLGTVETGKLADLVLLDANPLDDISNTRRIRAVVADGRLFRRADLDRLLASVETADLPEGGRY